MRYLIAAMTLVLVPGSAVAQASDEAREAEVRTAVHAFHAALSAGDSLGAIALLHPRVVVFESGHAETLEEYRSGHLGSDIAFAGAVRREIVREAVALRGDVALYTSQTRTTGEWRGRAIDAHGTETLVLERTPVGWRIRHIHWSSR